jgi:hypothetical protein
MATLDAEQLVVAIATNDADGAALHDDVVGGYPPAAVAPQFHSHACTAADQVGYGGQVVLALNG